jgi:hypothetical protein
LSNPKANLCLTGKQFSLKKSDAIMIAARASPGLTITLMRPRPLNHCKNASHSLVAAVLSLCLIVVLTAPVASSQAQPIAPLAQPTANAFWPQIDTYVGITPSVDFMFLASGTPGRDGTHPEFVLGPNIDIALWNFLTNLKTNNPERSKYLTLRIGYRYAKNLYDRETSNKTGVLELTPRVPLPWGFQIADRNRIDLQGLPDRFNWRYRNRLALLRSISIRSFAITPYAQVEVFYNCSLGEWSQYAYTFGAISRISPRVEIDTWYRRRTTFTEPVTRTNLEGVKLILFFRSFNK